MIFRKAPPVVAGKYWVVKNNTDNLDDTKHSKPFILGVSITTTSDNRTVVQIEPKPNDIGYRYPHNYLWGDQVLPPTIQLESTDEI